MRFFPIHTFSLFSMDGTTENLLCALTFECERLIFFLLLFSIFPRETHEMLMMSMMMMRWRWWGWLASPVKSRAQTIPSWGSSCQSRYESFPSRFSSPKYIFHVNDGVFLVFFVHVILLRCLWVRRCGFLDFCLQGYGRQCRFSRSCTCSLQWKVICFPFGPYSSFALSHCKPSEVPCLYDPWC